MDVAEDDAYFGALGARMATATPEAVMTVAVGRNLEAMLQGRLDPLEVFFNTPVLDALARHGDEAGAPRFGRYDFTDISTSSSTAWTPPSSPASSA